jgi:capsule biosynthesis phosphatase
MKKRIIFDLDETLCVRPKGIEHLGVDKYKQCTPITHMVDMVNLMYEAGHEIIIWTSRGMSSLEGDGDRIEQYIRPITEQQLAEWEVKYDELWLCKPHYDVMIDDKTIHPKATNPSLFYRIKNYFNINF